MEEIKILLYSTHTFSFVETTVLAVMAYLCFRKTNKMSRFMGFIFIFAIIASLGYVTGFSTGNKQLAHFGYFLYYSGISCMLTELYFFVVLFSGIKSKTSSRKTALTVTTLDIIMLLYFTITSGVCNLNKFPDYYNGELWKLSGWNWYFNIHLGISYFYSLGIVALLIYKICVSPKHNRAKYTNVLLIFMLIIIGNGVVIILKRPFDYTIFLYGIAAILIYLLCFKYYSRHYVLHTIQNIINSSERMVFIFDENHNSVWYNSQVKAFFKTVPDLPSFLEKQFEFWRNNTSQFDDVVNTYEWNIKWNEGIGNSPKQVHLMIQKNYDNLNNYIGCFFICDDITEKMEQEKEQKRLANMDPLTGVPKRDYFFTTVKQIIRTKSATQYLLVCSNIVDFNIYNSIFGEEAGNTVLKQNGAYIAKYSSRTPAFGRLSGDMFGLLIEEEKFNADPFLSNMDRMEKEFSNNFYHFRMQVGIVRITDLNESIASMVEKAILAMKLSKNDFTKRICWYNENSLNENLDEKIILGKFEKSLEEGEFKMFLQPQVTADNKVLGGEALARWIDAEGNIITPDKFIPVLESSSMITKLDRYIWEEAAKQLSKWKKMGREDLHISVNISIKDFYYEDLYQVFTDLVTKYEINPGNLNLEITETVFAADTRSVNELLQKLRDYGFHIELDDFGSGYSSLGLLKEISVDSLKIDMSFLRRSVNTSDTEIEKSWLILNEIARLAQALKMETIVEGVEEKDQVDKLTEFGCKTFQGFYFAKPGSVRTFEERINLY